MFVRTLNINISAIKQNPQSPSSRGGSTKFFHTIQVAEFDQESRMRSHLPEIITSGEFWPLHRCMRWIGSTRPLLLSRVQYALIRQISYLVLSLMQISWATTRPRPSSNAFVNILTNEMMVIHRCIQAPLAHRVAEYLFAWCSITNA